MNVTHWYHFIFSQTDELVRAQSACCNLTSPDLIWLLAQYFTDSQDTSTACLHKHNILFRIIFVCLLKNLHSEHLFACILFKLPPQQNKTAESRKRNISWKYLPYFICSWVCSWCLGMKDSFSFTIEGEEECSAFQLYLIPQQALELLECWRHIWWYEQQATAPSLFTHTSTALTSEVGCAIILRAFERYP